MKKNNKMTEFIRKKGFYIGLYSAAAIIVALAGVISLNNINMINNAKPDFVAEAEPFDLDQLEAVDKSEVKSYLETQENLPDAISEEVKKNTALEDDKKLGEVADSSAADNPIAVPKPEPKAAPKAAATPAPKQETRIAATPLPKMEPNQAPVTSATAPPAVASREPEKRVVPSGRSSSSVSDDGANKIAGQDGVFSFFDDNQLMSWPVKGDVVMDYSVETAIYDKTLEQYRTNNSICIAASVGSQVRASSEGIVTSITSSKEKGNTVVISHGNGWLTTYSQLQDNVLVKEGQIVKEGDVIGGVSEPSYYSILLGPHLEFNISKEGNSEDPKLYLASN